MEKKTYNWLLYQFSQRNACINILEVGICKRDKLLDWYSLDNKSSIRRNSVAPPINLTKYLLNQFLSKRVPILDEYNPEKNICYLYHRSGKKIITAKEASEMANNQLHGLQVTSIHLVLAAVECSKIFRVHCTNKNNELSTEITFENFCKEGGVGVKDQEIADKIMNFTLCVCEILARFCKPIESLKMDLVLSANFSVYLIKATEIVFSNVPVIEGLRDFRRLSTFKYEDEESEDITDEENQNSAVIHAKEVENKKKESMRYKIPMNKPVHVNSEMFLDMIAKTIQRKRRTEIMNEFFMGKTQESVDGARFRRNAFKLNTFDSKKENSSELKITSMNDLLTFIEKTRPSNWVQDNPRSGGSLAKFLSAKSQKFGSRRGSIGKKPETSEKILPKSYNKTFYFRKSKVVFNLKEISPVKLSHKRCASNLFPKNL